MKKNTKTKTALKTTTSTTLPVQKTIKLYINGEFPRTESGRSTEIFFNKSKKHFAHLCLGSRKDFRNAVTAAKEAGDGWQGKSAYNRGQILYRMAEMMQTREAEFVQMLVDLTGATASNAQKEVSQAVDAFIYFAGFSDKYQQILGAVNPVSGPHHNFTTPDSMGVVTLIVDKNFELSKLTAQIAAIIVSGNTLITLLPIEANGALLAPLAEVFATSDLPKGVINLITGSLDELSTVIGTHMEVNAISCQITNDKLLGEFKFQSVDNMKRVISPNANPQSLEHLMQYLEYKTVWHPIGV